MTTTLPQSDSVADAYETRIVPKYRAVAELLLDAAAPAEGESVVEVAAGTGGLARLMAPRLGTTGRLVVTDISTAMLEVAAAVLGRGAKPGPAVEIVAADIRSLPFDDATFDLAVAQFTPVLDSEVALRELRRVLKSAGRAAIASWGPAYSELDLLNRVRDRLGLPQRPNTEPSVVEERLQAAGFDDVDQQLVPIHVHHDSVESYLAYRAAFGRTEELDEAGWARYTEALEDEARQLADADGSVELTWSILLATARPKSS